MSSNSMLRMLIWIVMILGGIFISLYFDSILFAQIQQSIIFHIISFIVGVILVWSVLRVSRNTGRTLAKFGRKGNIKRMETNVLATKGIYKYMRHPMHLGLLFFPLSIAFLVNSPSFILIVAPIEIIFMLLMIKFVEEPEAIRKFGPEYLEYMKQVSWFCFTKQCLKELFKHIPKSHRTIEKE